MEKKEPAMAFSACPFSPVDQGQIDQWIEDAKKNPPTLFRKYRFDRRDLAMMVGNDGALVVEHVCEAFQLWTDGHEARMRRLRFALDSRGSITAAGEFALIELHGKPGKRTNQVVVALVDFLVPVLLALGIPWGSTTGAKMTRALDLVAVDLFGLPSTKSELQKRMRDQRERMAADRAAKRSFASQLAAHKASFVGPPTSPELRQAALARDLPPELMAQAWAAMSARGLPRDLMTESWLSMPREQRAAIRASVARGLESFRIQPPSDMRPSN